jgi:plasmid stabilization system protein ParE
MAPRYRILMDAVVAEDLEEIFEYIAKDSPRNAAGMVQSILDGIASLDTFPNRNVIELQPDAAKPPVRSLPIKPYIVFFRVDEDRQVVHILRVRHGARQPPRFP